MAAESAGGRALSSRAAREIVDSLDHHSTRIGRDELIGSEPYLELMREANFAGCGSGC